MAEHDAWLLERRLWLEGTDAFKTIMTPETVMLFPPPTGILRGQEILAALRGAPRWHDIDFGDAETLRHGAVTVLAYRATGQRSGGPAYHAYCSSTYLDERGRLRILCHQQTPAADGRDD